MKRWSVIGNPQSVSQSEKQNESGEIKRCPGGSRGQGFSLLLLLTLLLSSCGSEQPENAVVTDSVKTEKPVITFAVAGHVYGNPDHYTHSIYPSFLKKLREDHKVYEFDFLFLTGDVVEEATDSNWRVVARELNELKIQWFIAPGNHDLSDSVTIPSTDLLPPKQGHDQTFETIVSGRNHWIVLNTSNPGWTLEEGYAQVLMNHLNRMNKDSTDNIFVFTHQLWWQRNAPTEFELDSIRPNSYALYDGPSDFWQDVFPYFDSTGIETWFFAGDVGADEKLEPYFEDQYGRFHFYASGMGGGKADNYLIVSVYQNGHVDIERADF